MTKKCKYHCDYGDGENCHYKGEGDCMFNRGTRSMTDREKVISDIEQQIRWIEEIDCHKFPGWLNVTNAMRDALTILKEQETIQPKTGHWIDITNTIGFPRCECSECNSEAGAIWMKYCPNCGTKMEGR